MTNRWLFAINVYHIHMDLNTFMHIVQRQKWVIVDMRVHDHQIVFGIHALQQDKVKKILPQATLIKQRGLGFYILSFFRRPLCVWGMFFFVMTIFILNHTILQIDIVGDQKKIESTIQEILEDYQTPWLFYQQKDIDELYQRIKEKIYYDVSFFEIYLDHSRLTIQFVYNDRQILIPEVVDQLYASKEGVIAYFRLVSGNKVVDVNDFVRKNDLLVTSDIIDSKKKIEKTQVIGKVYAYTFETIEIERRINPRHFLDDAWLFYDMLFEVRQKIAQQIQYDEKILKENILHFTKEEGTIKMKVKYSLLECISSERKIE